jgi:hypothetical protein
MNADEKTPVIEAAMAILQATSKMRLGITVLNKALFYADLVALRDLGHSLTNSGYIALPQGPVLNHYERALIRDLDRQRLAEQIQEGWPKPVIVRQPITRFGRLTPEEVAIAQLVARKIEAKSATWVSEYSHENPGWQLAFRDKIGSGIDMVLAMQQVVDDDPWMDATPDESVREAFAEAETDDGVPF